MTKIAIYKKFGKQLYTLIGSGCERTILSELQVTALAMLYIGQLVICGIDYSFTTQTNFFSLHEKATTGARLGLAGKLQVSYMFIYVLLSVCIEMQFHGRFSVNLHSDHLSII